MSRLLPLNNMTLIVLVQAVELDQFYYSNK